jgi:hypothetical protein
MSSSVSMSKQFYDSVQRAKLVSSGVHDRGRTIALEPPRFSPGCEFKITPVYGDLFEGRSDTHTVCLIAWRKLWKFRAQTVSLTKIEVRSRSGTNLEPNKLI